MNTMLVSLSCAVLVPLVVASCGSSKVEEAAAVTNERAEGLSPVVRGSLDGAVLAEVNRYRRSKGKAALSENVLLANLAQDLANTMRSTHTVGHEGFASRAGSARNAGIFPLAENAGKVEGTASAKKAVAQWIASRHHKKNMLGSFNCAGVGTSSRDGQTYVGMVFGTR